MKKFFTACAVLFFCLPAFSRFYDPDFKLDPRVMNLTEDSFTVLFVTDKMSLCWVEIAEDDGVTWYQNDHPKYFQNISGRHYLGTHHAIKITGLKPGTAYRYRVLGKEIESFIPQWKIGYGRSFSWNPEWGKDHSPWSKTCTIKTLDPNASECRFSLVNDTHYNDQLLRDLVLAMPKNNDFLVLNGDVASYCQDIDTVLQHTFGPIREAVSSYPVFYVRGNHESRGAKFYLLPAEFPTRTGEFYFCFRQGPAAFVCLDAGEDKPDSDIEYFGTAAFDEYRAAELEWLKKVVQTPEFQSAPQKICIIHIPTLCSEKSWYTQRWITENFTPILEKAGVKLMLSGHHHRYILSPAGQDGSAYTVFVNSNTERADVTITAKSIHVETHSTDGKLVHSLDL